VVVSFGVRAFPPFLQKAQKGWGTHYLIEMTEKLCAGPSTSGHDDRKDGARKIVVQQAVIDLVVAGLQFFPSQLVPLRDGVGYRWADHTGSYTLQWFLRVDTAARVAQHAFYPSHGG